VPVSNIGSINVCTLLIIIAAILAVSVFCLILVLAYAARSNKKLKMNEERLKTTLYSIGDGVIAVDNNKKIIMMNKTAEELTGLEKKEALGKPLDIVFNIQEDEQNRFYNGKHRYYILDGRKTGRRYITITRNEIADTEGKIFGEVIVFKDMTEKKKVDDEILYTSYHDPLTDLYNRAFFEVEIRRLDTDRQYPLTVMIGDANGLKLTNDVFGHIEGDRLLKKIAEIMKSSARKEDIIARWGGDEFAIILPKTSEVTAEEIRERIMKACLKSDYKPVQPSLSIGYATKTKDDKSIIDLLTEAENMMYKNKLLEGKDNRDNIIRSFERLLVERKFEGKDHARRMQELAMRFGHMVKLSDDELNDLRLLSVLHDIGKVAIPDSILSKPSKLTDTEWVEVKKHSEKGYIIAKSIFEMTSIAKYILYHHERWDGKGYPNGLKGTEIPKLSRLISIVDAYDVMTNKSPYKKPLTHSQAIEEIKRCAGTQFDPELVEIFIESMEQRGELKNAHG